MILLRLFLIFTIIPIVELTLLIEIGRRIGTGATILLVLLTGALGAALTRSQGMSVLRSIRAELRDGRLPAENLVDGFLILIGGAFLVTPGLLTDLSGLILVIPATRGRIKLWLRDRLERAIEKGSFRLYFR